jgi:hypothetical protein
VDPVRRANLDIAARCWDSHPEREVANELRRGNGNVLGNDYALTRTPGIKDGEQASYRGRFDYTDDRYGASAEHMLIGRDFEPGVRYVRRTDFRRSFGQARFSPRPTRSSRIRKLTWQGSLDYVTDAAAAAVQNREVSGLFRIDFQTSDQLMCDYSREYERLPAAFTIAPGVLVPAGGYSYETTRASYVLGQQRHVSGRLSGATGTAPNSGTELRHQTPAPNSGTELRHQTPAPNSGTELRHRTPVLSASASRRYRP